MCIMFHEVEYMLSVGIRIFRALSTPALHTFSFTIDLNYVTLETKSIVARWTTVVTDYKSYVTWAYESH
jgi:hypothetical protein